MAKFIEATETEDEKLRNDVMKQILLYNEEDLAATWLVFEFVRWLSSANIEAEIDLSANYAGPLV
jgi:predicted RecB family nuclease